MMLTPFEAVLIERAARALQATPLLELRVFGSRARDQARATVGQSYSAAFRAVNALLVAYGLRPSTHDGSQTLFGLHFAKPGAVDPQLGKAFAQLYAQRLIADYKGVIELSPQDADDAVESARALLRAALGHLRPRVAGAPAVAARVDALLSSL